MIETQIIINRASGKLWFTAQKRKVHMFFRGRWKDITPIMQPTFEDAENLFDTTEKTLINDKFSKHGLKDRKREGLFYSSNTHEGNSNEQHKLCNLQIVSKRSELIKATAELLDKAYNYGIEDSRNF